MREQQYDLLKQLRSLKTAREKEEHQHAAALNALVVDIYI